MQVPGSWSKYTKNLLLKNHNFFRFLLLKIEIWPMWRFRTYGATKCLWTWMTKNLKNFQINKKWKKFQLKEIHLLKLQSDSDQVLERLFLGTFQDLLKWLNFIWELKKILLAKFNGLVIGFLVCYWDLWVLDFPCENLYAFNLLRSNIVWKV